MAKKKVQTKNKPGISTIKIIATAPLGFLLIVLLWATHSTCTGCGLFGAGTNEANPDLFLIAVLVTIIPAAQLILHQKKNFKHWVVADAIYYTSILLVAFAYVFLAFVALLV